MKAAHRYFAMIVLALGSFTARAADDPATPELIPHAPLPVDEAANTCLKTGHPRCQRFWDWLTYQPLTKSCCCACSKQPEPCCHPPLYAYFLEGCAGKAGACKASGGSCLATSYTSQCSFDRPGFLSHGKAG